MLIIQVSCFLRASMTLVPVARKLSDLSNNRSCLENENDDKRAEHIHGASIRHARQDITQIVNSTCPRRSRISSLRGHSPSLSGGTKPRSVPLSLTARR